MNKKELYQLIYDANSGFDEAKVKLAYLYYTGDTVNIDKEKAYKLWLETVDNKCIAGISTLGSIYVFEGKYDEAIKILEKGLEVKSGEAALILSSIYEDIKKDPVKTMEYLDMACEFNEEEAFYKKAVLSHDIDEQISLLNNVKNENGYYALGIIYLYQKKQYPEALKYLKWAAKRGKKEAYIHLSNIYVNGLGTNVNPLEGAKYCKMAADFGDEQAYFNLGNMYLKGEGVKQNYKEAFRYFKLADTKCGDLNAKHNLAILYLNGTGCQKNVKEAIRILEYCANHKQSLSIKALIDYYTYEKEDNQKVMMYQTMMSQDDLI